MKEGDIVSGVVKNLTDWGDFIDLQGVDAYLHNHLHRNHFLEPSLRLVNCERLLFVVFFVLWIELANLRNCFL